VESLSPGPPQEEEGEIFIPAEEVFNLPIRVRMAIANRIPDNYHKIKELTVELLLFGATKTKAEMQAYARQVWHKPYFPWYVLPAHWKAIGVEAELKREQEEGVTFEFYILKGIWIKPKVLNRLMEYNK
jgi:hypothetical protein